MVTVLVDFENVNSSGLQGLKSLTKEDKIYFFYNDASKINFDVHKSIENLECEKKYQKITTKTANALDFLLVTILGDLVSNNSESVYAIISNDTGYDVVVKYWNSKGVDIYRCNTVKEATEKAEAYQNVSASKTTEEKVDDLFKNTNSELDVDIPFIARSIDKYKTKAGLNNALLKEYGSDKTGAIFKVIKSLIKDKKEK